jgi:hypothetical protein
MAKRKKSPPDPDEKSSLSGRMRDLILAQHVEERREPSDGDDDARTVEEQRRRDDPPTKSPSDDG